MQCVVVRPFQIHFFLSYACRLTFVPVSVQFCGDLITPALLYEPETAENLIQYTL
jgi:hypothetical protein